MITLKQINIGIKRNELKLNNYDYLALLSRQKFDPIMLIHGLRQ